MSKYIRAVVAADAIAEKHGIPLAIWQTHSPISPLLMLPRCGVVGNTEGDCPYRGM